MAAWAEVVVGTGLKTCFELTDHRRTNYLHQEGLAQAFRIHEAETLAVQEYHRQEVQMSNKQHERENLQERYEHEEDIDLEKRVATRENIRDDWQQMSTRAEMVLIVNTLMLAVAFAMLIEGHLPDSMTLLAPAAMVAYFSSISSAICLLLSSVRFAVVLRFRVGQIIVQELREAIDHITHMDNEYRAHAVYKRSSRPVLAPAACDTDWDGASFTRSFCTQSRGQKSLFDPGRPPVSAASSYQTASADAAMAEGKLAALEETHLSFVHDRPEGFEDLNWVGNETGCTLQQVMAPVAAALDRCRPVSKEENGAAATEPVSSKAVVQSVASCARRLAAGASDEVSQAAGVSDEELFLTPRSLNSAPSGRGNQQPPLQIAPSAAGTGSPHRQPAATGQTAAAGLSSSGGGAREAQSIHGGPFGALFGTVLEAQSMQVAPTLTRADSRVRMDPKVQEKDPDRPVRPALHRSVSRLGSLTRENSKYLADADEDEYSEILEKRAVHNESVQKSLKEMQRVRCLPWEQSSTTLVFVGCFMLLIAACLLVYGRYYVQHLPLPPGDVSYPAAPWAAWGFTMPCIITVLLLVLLEMMLHEVRKSHRQRREVRKSERRSYLKALSNDSLDAEDAGLSKRYEVDVCHAPTPLQTSKSGLSRMISRMPSAFLKGIGADQQAHRLSRCLLGLIALNVPLFTVLAAFDRSHAVETNGNPPKLPRLVVEDLLRAPGVHWPSFWEPSGAAWMPQKQALLLLGGSNVVVAGLKHEVGTGKAVLSYISPLQPIRATGVAPLVDLCLSTVAADVNSSWAVAVDTEMGLHLATITSAGNVVGAWHKLDAVHDGAVRNSPRTVACRAVHATGVNETSSIGSTPGSSALAAMLEVWFSKSSGVWPVLAGGQVDPQRLPDFFPSMHWPSRWLLSDPTAEPFLRNITSRTPLRIESVEVTLSGALFILVSMPLSGLPQLLLAVSANGQLQRCWRLARPERAGSHWVALASAAPAAFLASTTSSTLQEGELRGQVFLVAGGVFPAVAVVRLPALYF